MLGVAGFGVALVAASVGARAEEQVQSRWMVAATRGLSFLLPVLAGLGLYAIWLRVDQHGWSPERVLAVLVALIVAGYGLAYAVAAVRSDWGSSVRRFNRVAALGVMALAVLWMTPLLDAYSISAKDQLARYQAGLVKADELALWELDREWGVAGKAAVAELEAMKSTDEVLSKQLVRLTEAKSKWSFRGDRRLGNEQMVRMKRVFELMPVRPKGRRLDLDRLSEGNLGRLSYSSCTQLEDGGEPDCVAVFGRFDPNHEEDGLLFLLVTTEPNQATRLDGLFLSDGFKHSNRVKKLDFGGLEIEPQEVIGKVLAGEFELVPSRKFDLSVGGERLELTR